MLIPHKLFQRVVDHYEGDVNRAKVWFDMPNPVLGGVMPKDYKIGGSWNRLSKMIDDALLESK